MSSNKDKTRTTKNSQRVKSLAEQQEVYNQVLANSALTASETNVPGTSDQPAGSSTNHEIIDDSGKTEQSPEMRDSEGQESHHVEKDDPHTGGEDKTKNSALEGKSKYKRIHAISSNSSDDGEESPPPAKSVKKGDPSLVKKRKVLKPKGRKTPPSAAAGSAAQLTGNQPQLPFLNPNLGQNQGFQQNQDPFMMMANLSRWMFSNQMGMGQLQNPMQNQPNQMQNQPFIAQDDDSSEEDESEDGDDFPSDPEIFVKSLSKPPALQQGKFEQECEEECKVILQEDDEATGPEAPEKLVNMIKNFLGRTKKQANIEDLLLKFPRPKNMPFLKSPKIEADLFPKLAKYIKNFDGGCRLLQQYLNAAITALVSAMAILLRREKLHEELSEAGSLVKNAVKLLAYTNKDINCRRKDALRNTVTAEFLPLLKHNRPSSEDWLLGQNLADSIKELEESKKVSDKILKPKKDFPQAQQNQAYKAKRFRYKKGHKKGRYQQGKQESGYTPPNNYQQNQASQMQGFQSAGLSQPQRYQQQAQYVQNQAQYFQNQQQNWKNQNQNNFQYNNKKKN